MERIRAFGVRIRLPARFGNGDAEIVEDVGAPVLTARAAYAGMAQPSGSHSSSCSFTCRSKRFREPAMARR